MLEIASPAFHEEEKVHGNGKLWGINNDLGCTHVSYYHGRNMLEVSKSNIINKIIKSLMHGCSGDLHLCYEALV